MASTQLPKRDNITDQNPQATDSIQEILGLLPESLTGSQSLQLLERIFPGVLEDLPGGVMMRHYYDPDLSVVVHERDPMGTRTASGAVRWWSTSGRLKIVDPEIGTVLLNSTCSAPAPPKAAAKSLTLDEMRLEIARADEADRHRNELAAARVKAEKLEAEIALIRARQLPAGRNESGT